MGSKGEVRGTKYEVAEPGRGHAWSSSLARGGRECCGYGSSGKYEVRSTKWRSRGEGMRGAAAWCGEEVCEGGRCGGVAACAAFFWSVFGLFLAFFNSNQKNYHAVSTFYDDYFGADADFLGFF